MGNSCQCDAEGSPTRTERRSESSASVGGAELYQESFYLFCTFSIILIWKLIKYFTIILTIVDSDYFLRSDGDFIGMENIELEDFRISLVRKVFQDACTEHSISGNEVPFRILIDKTLKINDARSILGSETFQRLSKHKAVDEEEALTFHEFIWFLEQQGITE